MERFEVTQSNIDQLLASFGVDQVVSSSIRENTKGRKTVTLNGAQTAEVSMGNGLEELTKGAVGPFVERLVQTLRMFANNSNALDLLQSPKFQAASLAEMDQLPSVANSYFQKLIPLSADTVPVFYGSTSGINFAEVLETGISTNAMQRLARAEVVFDYDSRISRKSQYIFVLSRFKLPESLQDEADRLKMENPDGLIGARLKSTKTLLARTSDMPNFNFIDTLDVFKGLTGDFGFTLGQLLLMSRIAGENPTLFTAPARFSDKRIVIDKNNLLKKADTDEVDALSIQVADFMRKARRPGGFTYYARDARIASLGGVMGIPFKLTEKANIYKVLGSFGSLYNGKEGGVLIPITRQRIQFREGNPDNEPIDPLTLQVLADKMPLSFQRLIRDFKSACKVLSVEEALLSGTKDNKFFIEDYF